MNELGLNLTHTWILVLRSVDGFSNFFLGDERDEMDVDLLRRLSNVGVATARNLSVEGDGDLKLESRLDDLWVGDLGAIVAAIAIILY